MKCSIVLKPSGNNFPPSRKKHITTQLKNEDDIKIVQQKKKIITL